MGLWVSNNIIEEGAEKLENKWGSGGAQARPGSGTGVRGFMKEKRVSCGVCLPHGHWSEGAP